MLHLSKTKLARISLMFVTLTLLAGCTTQSPQGPTPSNSPSLTPSASPTVVQNIVYSNTQYGFHFTLPLFWVGFSIVITKWEGRSDTGKMIETGPLLSIRHPLWTAAEKRQDIPIMVFTIIQWTALTAEDFHIGAAPIAPSELARNSQYVFALPARYNYAFPTGYQEVEEILKGNPLQVN